MRGQQVVWSAISDENSHGGGGRKRRFRPYESSNGPTVEWRRWRRARRSYERAGRRVFAVVSAHDDGDARSAMAELLLCCCGATGERRKSKWSRRVGRQACGVLMSRPAAPGCARRMACTSRRPVTGGNTRRLLSEPVSHDVHRTFSEKS